MDTQARLEQEVGLMKRKIQLHQTWWKTHLHQVKTISDVLESSHPPPLKPNAWATQDRISLALHRLSDIDKLIDTRRKALAQPGTPVDDLSFSLERAVTAKMDGPLRGCQTISCQLHVAVADTEVLAPATLTVLQFLETQISTALDKLETAVNRIYNVIASKKFLPICKALDLEQTIEGKLNEGLRLGFESRRRLEGKRDACRKRLKELGYSPVPVLMLAFSFSVLGIRVPRQTMITEYFTAPGSPDHVAGLLQLGQSGEDVDMDEAHD